MFIFVSHKKRNVSLKIKYMVFQIDNKDFVPEIFTRFSHDSKIIELCNELYNRVDWGLISTNNNVDNEYIIDYKQNIVDFISTITLRVVVLKDYPYKRLPIIDFENNELVSDTNQFNNVTILLNLTNFEKETFIEHAGQSIDQLLRIYNAINKKIEYDCCTNISAIDPTTENIARFSRQMLKFLEENARIGFCANYRPETINSQEFEEFKNYIDLFKRWLYTIDVTNKDDKDFEKLFIDTFNFSYNSKISDFNNLRNVLIFALYESLKIYAILLKYFKNEKDVKQIVQNK